jgi:hypothetical protein
MTMITIPIDPTAPQRVGTTAILHLGAGARVQTFVVAVDDAHAHFQLIRPARPFREGEGHGDERNGAVAVP